MDPIERIKDLQAELNSIRVDVRLVSHVNGIDVIGRNYADRLIARSELRKLGIEDKLIFMLEPSHKLSRT